MSSPLRASLVTLVLSAALACTWVPAAAQAGQNDGGSGADAPNTSDVALDVALGSYSGSLVYDQGADLGDWYRVVIPAGSTLDLTFTATSGSLYGGIYDDAGAFVTNAQSFGGSVHLHSTTSGAFRLGFGDQNGAGTATYDFSADASTPPSQNDAGSGTDAGNASDHAMNLALGTYSGTLLYDGHADAGDWYRVVVPTGSTLDLTFAATSGELYGGIYTDAGAFVTNAQSFGSTVHLHSTTSGAFRLGFGDENGAGSAAYTFTASATSGHNDAGSGTDAGNASDHAMDLALGTYSGSLVYDGHADAGDWYRVVVPTGSTLDLTFTATSGEVYGGIYTDAGAFITNAQSTGGSVHLQSTTSGAFRLGFGDENGVGTATYSFTASATTAPQNDAGSGTDAGNTSDHAMTLALGTYSGSLAYDGNADKGDWYRVVVPAGSTLSFTFTATSGGVWGGIYNDQGGFITNAYSSGSSVHLDSGASGAFRVGIGDENGVGTAAYSFSVAAHEIPQTGPRCQATTGGSSCSFTCVAGDVIGASGIHAGARATCGGATASCNGSQIDCLAGGSIVQRADTGTCTMTTSTGEYAECFAIASTSSATCSTSADYGACTFSCKADGDLNVSASSTNGGWPRVLSVCGGGAVSCQSAGACAAHGTTPHDGDGICLSRTVSAHVTCATSTPPPPPPTTPPPVASANLTLAGGIVTPAHADLGAWITANVTLANRGDAAGSGRVQFRVLAIASDNSTLATLNASGDSDTRDVPLGANASVPVSFRFSPVGSGDFAVLARLDNAPFTILGSVTLAAPTITPPVHATPTLPPTVDAVGALPPGVDLRLALSPAQIYASPGDYVNLEVIVTDFAGDPAGAEAPTFANLPAGASAVVVESGWSLLHPGGEKHYAVTLVIDALAPNSTSDVLVHVRAAEGRPPLEAKLHLTVGPHVPTVTTQNANAAPSIEGRASSARTAIYFAAGAGAVGAGAVVLARTRYGRALASLAILPLYTRLKRGDVLENEVRAGVYRAIQSTPGVRFEALRKELGLATGALLYHLRVLERERYVSVSRDWTRRVYYATGTTALPAGTTVEQAVLSILASEIRLSPSGTAERLGISRQLARYHLRALERKGVLHGEGSGANLVYRRVEAAR